MLNGLGSKLALEDIDELIVGQWALSVDLLALLGTSDLADLGSQIELDSWGGDIDNAESGRGSLRQESLEHGGLLGAASEVFVDELLHGGGTGGLGVDVADVGLGAVVIVFEGSLEHDLFNLDGVVVVASFNGTSPTGASVGPTAPTTAPVSGCEGVANLESDEGADEEALHHGGGGDEEEDGDEKELHFDDLLLVLVKKETKFV